MKLLLTSNGIDESIEAPFLSLLEKNPAEASVSFVNTAVYGEEENLDWLLLLYKQQLQKCGITDIKDLDVRDKTLKELEGIVTGKDIIFMAGGNTFYLLDAVRKSGFSEIVKSLVSKGVLYVGASAGSIIAGPTIESAGWEPEPDINYIGITDFTGLHFVDFLISPHFDNKYRSMIEARAKSAKYPVIPLTDTQAILTKDNDWEIIGTGERLIFESGFKPS